MTRMKSDFCTLVMAKTIMSEISSTFALTGARKARITFTPISSAEQPPPTRKSSFLVSFPRRCEQPDSRGRLRATQRVNSNYRGDIVRRTLWGRVSPCRDCLVDIVWAGVSSPLPREILESTNVPREAHFEILLKYSIEAGIVSR